MLTISSFTGTADEYAAVVAIWNANWPDRPETIAEWQRRDGQRSADYAFTRFVVNAETGIVAYGGYEEPVWSAGTGTYVLFYEVDPAADHNEIHALLCDHVMACVRGFPGAVKLITANLREDKPRKIAFLLANGFVQVMRHPISRLDVTTFDAAPYAARLAQVADAGFVIQPLSALQQHDLDWRHHLWLVEEAAFQTIPTVTPVTARPYNEYSKRFDEPGFTSEAWFVATDQTQTQPAIPYVGLSALWPSHDDPTLIDQGFTGVHPSYRRRGIGTALKVHTIVYAKARGATYIVTANAEENAMYQLNLQLGFEPLPAWVNLEKKL